MEYLNRPVLNGRVNFPLCLAPMVGLSHAPLRRVLRRYLPKGAYTLWPTEMLNSRRLPHEDLQKTPEAMRYEDEVGLVPQILGNDKEAIEASVRKLEIWGAEGIDINMGCPVQKALKHNYGVALMGDASYAAEVVRMTVQSTKLPVSVKLRAGVQGDYVYLKNFVQGIEEAGAAWVCLHPRTAEQKRRGYADWTQIERLRKDISIPLIGNGDIQKVQDVIRMLNSTGCDMVMAGRALAAKPWMLWQLGEILGFDSPEYFQGRQAPQSAEEEAVEYGESLKQLWKELEALYGLNLALRKLRFHIRTTSVWLNFGHRLYGLSTAWSQSQDVQLGLEEFFSRPLVMYAETELRA